MVSGACEVEADVAVVGTTPYRTAAPAYLEGGWCPLPLPPGEKHPPPTGWTGYQAPWPSGADVHAWSESHGGHNIGLRLPETVIGLDVDAYGDKPGEVTMRSAMHRLGPLPLAPRSTSRGPDDVSGIRFYRVPAGRRWADTLGPGVEVIHHGHRYAVVWPSVHPLGAIYQWFGCGHTRLAMPPTVEELPELPVVWVNELDRGSVTDRPAKADVGSPEVTGFLAQLPAGAPCQYVARVLGEARVDLSAAASRHDTVRDHLARLVRAGEQGHHGISQALPLLEADWLSALRRGDPREPDVGEWSRMLTGAVAMVTRSPTPAVVRRCCGEPATVSTEAVAEDVARFAFDVSREAHRLRVQAEARRRVAAEAAAADDQPFDAGSLAEVLARPADPPHRVEGLIPSEAGTLIVAQRKTGKTTLELNLVRSLLTGEPFLGRFDVRPIRGCVGLLNFEVSANQLARWASDVAVPDHRLFLVNLRGRRNPLGNDADRRALAAWLRDHKVETLMVDPFGRAYTGTNQNDAGEVGAWLADLDRFTRSEVGAVDLVLAAHAGWNGERTRGASALEDWADSIITLTRDPNDETARYLRAMGRDVEVDEDGLQFDPATRLLSLMGRGSRKQANADRHIDHLVHPFMEVVRAEPGLGIAEITTRLRNHGQRFQDRDITKVSEEAQRRGLVRTTQRGNGSKKEHHAIPPSNDVRTPSTDVPHTPSTPSL